MLPDSYATIIIFLHIAYQFQVEFQQKFHSSVLLLPYHHHLPCLSIHSTTLFVKTKFIYIVNHFSIWQIGMCRCLAQIFPCYIRLNNGRHHILKHIFSLILAVYPTGIVDLITIIASGLYSITSLITASTSDVSKNFFLLS